MPFDEPQPLYIDCDDCPFSEHNGGRCEKTGDCSAYVKDLQEGLDNLLGQDGPWPLDWVLEALSQATLHLLNVHNCDGHGYELSRDAVRRAGEYLNIIQGRKKSVEEEGKAMWTQAAKDMEEMEEKGMPVRDGWRQDPRIKHTPQYRHPKEKP